MQLLKRRPQTQTGKNKLLTDEVLLGLSIATQLWLYSEIKKIPDDPV